jgi:hypothetical protein
VVYHVLETIQGVHAFTGASRPLFIPALATGAWLFSIKELLPEILHVFALLYLGKIRCG